MATTETELKPAPSAPPKAAPAPAAASTSKVVIVDIGERQSTGEVRSLLKGEGKLMDHVEKILADLVTAGTVASTAQPVVFVVRELSTADDDDDLDD
jgi:hypothetical protein